MNPESIQVYLSFLAPCVTLLFTTVVFLQKFVKNKRLKKILEKTEEITREIIPCIAEAEKLSNYSGTEKKEYVMTKLNQYAIKNNISFDEEEASRRVEELVALTKEVNISKSTEKIVNKEPQSIEEKIKNIMEGLVK